MFYRVTYWKGWHIRSETFASVYDAASFADVCKSRGYATEVVYTY